MRTFTYVLKRLGLGLITFFIIMTINFMLIKMLQPELPMNGWQAELEMARRRALGYDKPIIQQYVIFLKNIITTGDWGTSWKIDYLKPAQEVIASKLPPTIILNLYSTLLSIPLGILFGVIAAIYKNKWIDHVISIVVMLFISVPSFVYAFLLQYILGFKLGWFPVVVSSLFEAGGSWWTAKMFHSMVLPILSLSFGAIAGFTRSIRAELTEALTSEYMLLARTKGLTRGQAIRRHALKNAMVPILPGIIAFVLSIMGGAIITEKIFAINGIGKLYITSIQLLDYDLFVATGMFYTAIGLITNIVTDLSYGLLDPRIRIGER